MQKVYYPERLSLTVQDNRGPWSALTLFVECLFQIGLCQALGVDGWKARSALGKQWLSQCMEGKAGSAGSRGGSAAVPSTWSRAHLSVRSGVSACGHPDLCHSELLGRRLAEEWGHQRSPESRPGDQDGGQVGYLDKIPGARTEWGNGKKESCWQASGQTFQWAPWVHSPGDQLRM